jgi:uncharacterized protein (DUF58 family)
VTPAPEEASRSTIRDRQRRLWFLAVVVVALGIGLGVPALLPIALVLGILALAREAWLRRGLRGIEYRRDLSTRRCIYGDEVVLSVSVWNRSIMPVGWLTVEDEASDNFTLREVIAGGDESAGGESAVYRQLRNAWTLLPFERVERRFHLLADRRGRVAFGPAHLETSDLFAGIAAAGDIPAVAELVIAPRVLPLRQAEQRSRWHPVGRPLAGFPEDPSLFAGVRAYLPGDPPRRIHWKATARTGSPRSKRYDASREREVVVALDIQTDPGRVVSARYDPDLVEAMCVTTASLLRDGLAAGMRCGLAAAAYSYRPLAQVRMLPAAGPRQLLTLMDVLGRLSPWPSGPFETLLGGLARWVPRTTDIVVVTGRDGRAYLPILLRLRSLGYGVRIVAVGPAAEEAADGARRAGIRLLTATLLPDWRSADAIALAG